MRDPSGHRFYAWTVAALGLLYLLPVLLTAHLPMQDVPVHLAIVDTLSRMGDDPAWGEHFAADLGPRPYVTYYAAALALAPWLGTEGANRLLLALYVAAFLAAAGYMLRSVGEPRANRWTLLLFLPLVYSDFYLIGLTNFLLSLPLLIFGAGLCLRVGSGRGRRWPQAAALGLAALLLYLTHPLTLCYLMVLAAGVTLAARTWKDRQALALTLAPAAVLLLLFIAGTAGFGGSPIWPPLGFKLRYLLETPLIFAGAVDRPLFWTCALLLAALLAAGLYRAWKDLRRRPTSLREHGSLFVLGAALAAYAAAPGVLGSTVWFDARLAYLAWLSLLFCLGPHLLRTRVEKLAALALCVACLSAVQLGHRRFDREIEPLFEILEETPPGARLFALALDPASAAIEPFYVRSGDLSWFSLYAQAGTYYHLYRGGVSPFMTFYAGLPWLPLRLHDELYEQAFSIADPFDPNRLLSRLPALQGEFDLVLVRGLTSRAAAFLEPLATPVAQEGPFTLLVMKHRLPPSNETE